MVRKEIYSVVDGFNGDNQGKLICRTTNNSFCNKKKSFYGNNDKVLVRNVLMNFQSMCRKFLMIIYLPYAFHEAICKPYSREKTLPLDEAKLLVQNMWLSIVKAFG